VPRVPLASPKRVGEQLVRLLDGEKLRAIAARRVGVIALREAPMRSLDLVEAGVPADAEQPVWVGDVLHHALVGRVLRGGGLEPLRR
jgi:hypothetical protein